MNVSEEIDAGPLSTASGLPAAPFSPQRLTVDQVKTVALPWWSRYTRARLRAELEHGTVAGWIVPATREYLITTHWRYRPDIGQIVEVGARRGRRPLLEAALAGLRAAGCALVIVESDELARSAHWYEANGFGPIDRIVTLETRQLPPGPAGDQRLKDGTPGASVGLSVADFSSADRAPVMAVDHAAFPWLWWNSAEEFRQYLASAEVCVLVGRFGRQVVGYVGSTVRDRWGHVDRLAVDPQFQRRGVGAQLLEAALARLAAAGARRVALTTQHDNEPAQRLYYRFGFRPTGQVQTLVGRRLSAEG